MIALNDIKKAYGSKIILNNIDLKIDNGEFVVISGLSGSGKSTLINIIGHLDTADEGFVKINGRVYSSKKELRELRKNYFGYIFQNYALIDNETVETNLMLAVEDKGNKKEKIKQVLSKVGLENSILTLKINQLSGGEQQRVAIARVLLKPFQTILADEPTGNLDNKNKEEIFKLLKSIQGSGKTVICVSHDMDIQKYADKIISLENENLIIT
ncbi:ABC transporter ATP-binding protein [Bacillus thuringiensis]|uniref:ABC transporter ATP-binding protein n=1 Tax=Bacillus thuringiensis TaxID=1428 RepID=UPI0010403B58|nr:ABC transporter ATP-binding protein [Bacillus thuringiensis]TBX38948.1 ABC transporter ATP-binding protein [Bacillus thuringiensis]